MEYDRGDSFLFDFELKGIPFSLKLKGKLSSRSYTTELNVTTILKGVLSVIFFCLRIFF